MLGSLHFHRYTGNIELNIVNQDFTMTFAGNANLKIGTDLIKPTIVKSKFHCILITSVWYSYHTWRTSDVKQSKWV